MSSKTKLKCTRLPAIVPSCRDGLDTDRMDSERGGISLVTGRMRRRKRKKKKRVSTTEEAEEGQNSSRSIILEEGRQLPRSAQQYINPTNIAQERNLFLLDQTRENPIFEYSDQGRCDELLDAHSKPNTEYLSAAIRVIENCLAKYGSESRYLTEVGDMIVNEEQACDLIGDWLRKNDLADEVKLHFNRTSVAAASMQGNIFHVGVPVQLRMHRITSVCNHEMGTHYLRGYNEKLQRWHKRREKFGLGEHLVSEEGLACLNTHLEGDKTMWKAALHYYTAVRASSMSFKDLFRDLLKYIDDPESAWRQCVRFKRGLVDTSQPGAYCRDQCYFEGAMRILRRRRCIDFQKFHCGKITLEAYNRIKDRIITHGTRLPSFLKDPERYLGLLQEIIDTNGIQEFCGDGAEAPRVTCPSASNASTNATTATCRRSVLRGAQPPSGAKPQSARLVPSRHDSACQ